MDVVFETQGEEFSIELGYWDTVLEIKEKIHKYHGVPVAKQTLVFNGHVLNDESDVDKCLILDSSRIQLLVAGDDPKRARVVKQEPPPEVADQADPPDPQQTPESNGIAPSSSVRDPVDPLEGNVAATAVASGSDVQHQHHQQQQQGRPGGGNGSRKMRVMVLPKSGNGRVPVEVSATDNVGELRKELQRLSQRLHFHLPQEGYFFIYKQVVMDEDRTFRWHHVVSGDTIEIFNGNVTGGS